MNILQIHSPYRQAGGEDVVVEREAALLRRAGHKVDQHLAPNPSDTMQSLFALAGAVWNPRSYLLGSRLGESLQPEIVHVHNTWFALSPSIVAGLKKAQVPVVMTLHNYRLLCANGLLYRDASMCTECVGRHPLPAVRHRCYKSSTALSMLTASSIGLNRLMGTWSQGVDLFVALTEFGREVFIRGGIPPERIAVKPHFVPDPGPREAPPSESSTVLYVGRITQEKGLPVLLDAWEAATPAGLELVVVGEGPLRHDLEMRRVPAVRFVGEVESSRVKRMMLAARALVFPSQWFETFGLVMIEALASGLPVVGSDLGGNSEVLANLGEDWLVKAGDVGAWRERLVDLTKDSVVDRSGAVARSSYEKRYSEESGLANLEELYEEVLRKAT